MQQTVKIRQQQFYTQNIDSWLSLSRALQIQSDANESLFLDETKRKMWLKFNYPNSYAIELTLTIERNEYKNKW